MAGNLSGPDERILSAGMQKWPLEGITDELEIIHIWTGSRSSRRLPS